MKYESICSPSLALIKYWGKEKKIFSPYWGPATSSLAINLECLSTRTYVSLNSKEDQVYINDQLVRSVKVNRLLTFLRKKTRSLVYFTIHSYNNFPTSSGLASSSSAFASIAGGAVRALGLTWNLSQISFLAGLGSLSASRAVLGGFNCLKKRMTYAQAIYSKEFWPELRVIVVITSEQEKLYSSTEAMYLAQQNHQFFQFFKKINNQLFHHAVKALKEKNIKQLGQYMKESYHYLFQSLHILPKSIYYWNINSFSLIKYCQSLRDEGSFVFETMDAGPHVKILTIKDDVDWIKKKIQKKYAHLDIRVTKVGSGVQYG